MNFSLFKQIPTHLKVLYSGVGHGMSSLGLHLMEWQRNRLHGSEFSDVAQVLVLQSFRSKKENCKNSQCNNHPKFRKEAREVKFTVQNESIFDQVRSLVRTAAGGPLGGGNINLRERISQLQVNARVTLKDGGEEGEDELSENEIVQLFSEEDELQVNARATLKDGGEEGEDELSENEPVQLFFEDEVKAFFNTLDEELRKVKEFYKLRESELLERGEALNKQLQILLDLKQILIDRRKKSSSLRSLGSSGGSPSPWPSSGRNSDFSASGSPGECEGTQTETGEVIAALERNGLSFVAAAARSKAKAGSNNGKTTVRIDVPAMTPTLGITAASNLWDDLVNNPKRDGQGDFDNRKKRCV
ncbi:hypothetical protein SAY87_030955 [Trapa incisa]|uniref:SPX domain-containing protein n=1 Tax=Trapa incisa TaxID=236973 RepID=A0AAN7KU28_9MYRT|nr:hypothetical protein SAY87_030955 [Trapa incisa]